MARRGATTCWIPFSSAVPGFALQIVSAWFVTFVFQWWRVRSARGCLYISESNVTGQASTPLGVDRLEPLVQCNFHVFFCQNAPKIAFSGSSSPFFRVFERFFMIFGLLGGFLASGQVHHASAWQVFRMS